MALLLRRKGVQRIRPLAGGLEAWRELGFPTARNDAGDTQSATASSAPPHLAPS